MTARPSAFAACAYCGWKAQHRADSEPEAAEFLVRLLGTHVRDDHPQQHAEWWGKLNVSERSMEV